MQFWKCDCFLLPNFMLSFAIVYTAGLNCALLYYCIDKIEALSLCNGCSMFVLLQLAENVSLNALNVSALDRQTLGKYI